MQGTDQCNTPASERTRLGAVTVVSPLALAGTPWGSVRFERKTRPSHVAGPWLTTKD